MSILERAENRTEEYLANYPIYQYAFVSPDELMFTQRVREVCRAECDRYGTSWSCPPAVGSVAECEKKCRGYSRVLFFSTVAETSDILNMEESLRTKKTHEKITRAVENYMRGEGLDVMTLSSNSCAICDRCTCPDAPCRHPDMMHPCIESHGIVVSSLAEHCGMDYTLGDTVFLWFSLIFFR